MSTRKLSNIKIKINTLNSKNIPIRDNGDNYYYVTNFEQTTEKECKEFDKTNRIIYEKYVSTYKKIEKQLENCPFKLDKSPQPPESPTNLERFVNWKRNNIERNVRLQTISVIYLLSKNYNISLNHSDDGVLPYNIINEANRESGNNLELMIEESNYYLELKKNTKYIKNETRESSTDDDEENNSYGFNNKNNNNSNINLYPNIINQYPTASAPPY